MCSSIASVAKEVDANAEMETQKEIEEEKLMVDSDFKQEEV